MKVLCDLDMNGNSIQNAAEVDGQIPVILYETTFTRTSSSDSNYETIDADTSGVINPIVQVFEQVNGDDEAVIVDVTVDSTDNDVTITFGEETVASWDEGSVTYKVRIIGQDANAASGEGT